jgi:hypothetical protein
MSGTLRDTLGSAYIEQQAEHAEDIAAYCRDNHLPGEADQWQVQANTWRIELPPMELEPGEIIDAAFCEIEPEP